MTAKHDSPDFFSKGRVLPTGRGLGERGSSPTAEDSRPRVGVLGSNLKANAKMPSHARAAMDIVAFGDVPLMWQIQGTGDVNNDLKTDILWRSTGGDVSHWLMAR